MIPASGPGRRRFGNPLILVLAPVSGGTATATNIEDLSLLRAGHAAPSGNGPGSTSG